MFLVFSCLFSFRFNLVILFYFTFDFVSLILLLFLSFYFLSTCTLWVISRFGGIFVVCGSFVRSSVRFCGHSASSGWSEHFDLVSFVQFTFILFGIFIVCSFRWLFRSGLVLVGTCSFFVFKKKSYYARWAFGICRAFIFRLAFVSVMYLLVHAFI